MKFDCFTFYNEFDLLEMRLEELYPVVDRFIMVDSDTTFSGNPKKHLFWDEGVFDPNSRWAPYVDKIVYANYEMPKLQSAWDREFSQRNYIGEVLKQFHPALDDWILISDVDEIPRRSVVEKLGVDYIDWGYTIDLPAYYGGLNVYGGHSHSAKAVKALYFNGAQRVRQNDIPQHIPNGGWHFSYLGDEEFIINKIRSYAHTELNTPENTDFMTVAARLASQQNLWGTGETNTIVEIDDTWPEAYKRDPERWADYVWESD